MIGSSLKASVTATDMLGAIMMRRALAERGDLLALDGREAGGADHRAGAGRRHQAAGARAWPRARRTRRGRGRRVMARGARRRSARTPSRPTPASLAGVAAERGMAGRLQRGADAQVGVTRGPAPRCAMPIRPAAPATTSSSVHRRGAPAPDGRRINRHRNAATGYLTSAYCRRIPRSVSRFASLIRHIGSRNSGSSMPAIAIASLMGIGLVSRNAARASGKSR